MTYHYFVQNYIDLLFYFTLTRYCKKTKQELKLLLLTYSCLIDLEKDRLI